MLQHPHLRAWTRDLRRLALSTSTCLLLGGTASTLLTPIALAQTASPLTLDDAIARAVASDPGLRAAQASVDAATGGLTQTRTRPNPELGVEVENFNGAGALRGFDGAETTFSLNQEIELGGQRRARIVVADRELRGAELDQVIRGLDLIREIQEAYYGALAADQVAAIERERLATARALYASVARRVSAARDPLMAGARAESSLAEAQIALARADAAAANARARLASYWGGDNAFILVATEFSPPRAETHAHDSPTESSPDLARLSAERDRANAEIRLERSLGFQNPTLSIGYRQFLDTGDDALVAGVTVPLGIFNRNQGAVTRARALERRTIYDLEAGRQALTREFSALQRSLDADARAALALEEDVIPQAERALALAQDGYNRGAFSYLDVLEAQRALTDAREARVEALLSFHNNEAAIDRLTARFAATPMNGADQ